VTVIWAVVMHGDETAEDTAAETAEEL
jgi:hypothetical protein